MYRSEAFTEGLHINVGDDRLIHIEGMDELTGKLKKFSRSVYADELSKALSIDPSRTLLLNGSPGLRKLRYAFALCGEFSKKGWTTLMFDPSEFLGRGVDEFDKRLTKAFNEIVKCEPCAVICNDIELFCRSRINASYEEMMITRSFISLFRELRTTGAQFMFAALSTDTAEADPEFLKLVDEMIDVPCLDSKALSSYFRRKLRCVSCTEEAVSLLCKAGEGADDDELKAMIDRAKRALYDDVLTRANGDIKAAAEIAGRGEAVLTLEIAERSLEHH